MFLFNNFFYLFYASKVNPLHSFPIIYLDKEISTVPSVKIEKNILFHLRLISSHRPSIRAR